MLGLNSPLFENVSDQAKEEMAPFMSDLSKYISSVDKVVQLLCYRIMFLEKEEKVMRTLAHSWHRDGGDDSLSTIRNGEQGKTDGANEGLAAVMAEPDIRDEQVLAVSSSQVSVPGAQRKLRTTEHRWLRKLVRQYKNLKAASKAVGIEQNIDTDKKDPNISLKKPANNPDDRKSTDGAVSVYSCCKEVLKYYIQRELIKQTVSKDYSVQKSREV